MKRKVDRKALAGVVQLLQQDPASYKSYGMYWWPLKRWLRREVDEKTLPLVHLPHPHDEPETVARLEALYPDEWSLFMAALHHAEQKTLWGERYQGHSYWPAGEGYVLDDPDMGPANTVGA